MTSRSLSTMWAQQERFADMQDFAHAAQTMGYDAIELSHLTGEKSLRRLLDGNGVRLSSVHAPGPKAEVGGEINRELNLAALDEADRRAAIEQTERSIDFAAAEGASFVIVHLGAVGDGMLASERTMRRLFDSGTRDGPEMDALRQETIERRAERAPAYLEKARETLAELSAYARAWGVALGIETRFHYHEIPQVDEALALLADYPPELVGYWHDVGHAEVQSRLGYVDKRAWLDALASRTIGCHLHDVDGLGDHRAPGRGDVEWEYVARGLPAEALRVFEIDQRQPEEAVAGAIAFLRERGVVA